MEKSHSSNFKIIIPIFSGCLNFLDFYLILTDIKILSRFSKVDNCGINFWTTLLNASNIEWS